MKLHEINGMSEVAVLDAIRLLELCMSSMKPEAQPAYALILAKLHDRARRLKWSRENLGAH